MCGICSAYGHIIGSAMYAVQKVITCFALTAVTTCVIITILIMLGVGIGLGYHYCVVQTKTRPLSGASNNTSLRSGTENQDEVYRRLAGEIDGMLSLGKDKAKPATESSASATVQSITQSISTTKSETRRNIMIVPVDGALDLTSLISKIRRLKKNFTLEFIY